MFKMLPIAIALMMVLLCLERADAIPLGAHGLSTPSNVTPVYYRGGVARGPRGGVAVRGPRGGVAVVGPRGGVAVRGGAYRVGGRYYGGVWYGHARRWYGGRWWAYGVGSCWAPSPIGYVWVCG
jgi:hypothetical protein